MNIAINGFGRIGRMAFRAIRDYHPELNVVAIRDPASPAILAHLLQRDSVYGRFPGDVSHEGDYLIVDGKRISCDGQPLMTWWAQGVDVVLECAGGGPDGDKARRHLELGAKRVIISAPAPNVDATILMGVNEDSYDPAKHHVISMGSCTANCVGPIVKTIASLVKVYSVRLETLNAYTNSQRLVDAPHKDARLSAAAVLNVIPSESSAVPLLCGLFPDIHFSGRAYRVPVACGSMAMISLLCESVNLPWDTILASPTVAYADMPMVSSDVIMEPESAIIDPTLTEIDGKTIRLVAWYDNEFGYGCRLADLAAHIGQVHTSSKG